MLEGELHNAYPFCSLFNFIKNLSAIKDFLEFDKYCKDTYPSELELKKENISTSGAFLKLSIVDEDEKCKTKLYDKIDGFTFSDVRFQHLESNITSNINYVSRDSEILSFARTASDSNKSKALSNRFLKKMQKQGSKH